MKRIDRILVGVCLCVALGTNAGCGAARPIPATRSASPQPAVSTAPAAPAQEENHPQTGGAVEEASQKVFLWEVRDPRSDKDRIIYLLGSIHAGHESFYPVEPVIEDAYASSQTLVVEVDLTAVSQGEMQETVRSMARLPRGTTVDSLISPDTWEKLVSVLETYGMTKETVLRSKPWFAAMLIATLRVVKDGFRPDLGLDQYFIGKGDKEIVGLESIQFQLKLFDNLSAELEELLLLDAIEGSIQAGGDIHKVLEAWKKGDPAALQEVMLGGIAKQPRFKPLYKRLVTDRNRTMATRIIKLNQKWETLFVVVGAGHLVGTQGLVAIFEKKGYRVRQLEKY